jgi:hypothetical protein
MGTQCRRLYYFGCRVPSGDARLVAGLILRAEFEELRPLEMRERQPSATRVLAKATEDFMDTIAAKSSGGRRSRIGFERARPIRAGGCRGRRRERSAARCRGAGRVRRSFRCARAGGRDQALLPLPTGLWPKYRTWETTLENRSCGGGRRPIAVVVFDRIRLEFQTFVDLRKRNRETDFRHGKRILVL